MDESDSSMDTSVSELTSRMSNFGFKSPGGVKHVRSFVMPSRGPNRLLSSKLSTQSLSAAVNTTATPLKARLQSLNLNPDVSYSSKIPLKSPVVSRASTRPRRSILGEESANRSNRIGHRLSMIPGPVSPEFKHKQPSSNHARPVSLSRLPVLSATASSTSTPRRSSKLHNNFVAPEFSPKVSQSYKALSKKVETPMNRRSNTSGSSGRRSTVGPGATRYTSVGPTEKRLKLETPKKTAIPKVSVEKIRERRLQAIRDTGEHLYRQRARPSSLTPQVQAQVQAQAHAALIEDPVRWHGRVSTLGELYSLLSKDPKLSHLFHLYLDSEVPFRPSVPTSSENLGKTEPELYNQLSVYEKGEVLKSPEIYYVGHRGHAKTQRHASNSFKSNFGFDDEEKNYRCYPGDHIQYRYEICDKMGKGTFGSVISAKDHKTGRVVAVKIVKNHMEWSLQAVNEVKFLKKFSELGSDNIIKYVDHFHFRSHMCIVTELLSVNLFQVIEATKFRGLGLGLVKQFSRDMLNGLQYIHDCGAIHCDMKPENLMLAFEHGQFHAKLIDFGSSCNADHLCFSYLQSRYYRAPEVLLGARYDSKIDIWSFGAIVVELFVGMPIFQASDEYSLLDEFISYFGIPPRHDILWMRKQLLKEGPIAGTGNPDSEINRDTLLWRAFTSEGLLDTEYLKGKRPKLHYRPSTKTIKQFVSRHAQIRAHETSKMQQLNNFSDFASRCFAWDGKMRSGCSELLQDRFLQ